MTTTAEHPHTALALLAVDALDGFERRRAARHARRCAPCRRSVDDHRATLAALVPDLAPPDRRVWAGIVSTLSCDCSRP